MSRFPISGGEVIIPSPDELVDLSRIPPVETPPEGRLIKVVWVSGCLATEGRPTWQPVEIKDLVGDPLQLLNTLLINRDYPKTIPDLWRAGFRMDLPDAQQARYRFEAADSNLAKAFGAGDGARTPELVQMQQGSRRTYQFNPNVVFYDENDRQLSPTWDLRPLS